MVLLRVLRDRTLGYYSYPFRDHDSPLVSTFPQTCHPPRNNFSILVEGLRTTRYQVPYETDSSMNNYGCKNGNSSSNTLLLLDDVQSNSRAIQTNSSNAISNALHNRQHHGAALSSMDPRRAASVRTPNSDGNSANSWNRETTGSNGVLGHSPTPSVSRIASDSDFPLSRARSNSDSSYSSNHSAFQYSASRPMRVQSPLFERIRWISLPRSVSGSNSINGNSISPQNASAASPLACVSLAVTHPGCATPFLASGHADHSVRVISMGAEGPHAANSFVMWMPRTPWALCFDAFKKPLLAGIDLGGDCLVMDCQSASRSSLASSPQRSSQHQQARSADSPSGRALPLDRSPLPPTAQYAIGSSSVRFSFGGGFTSTEKPAVCSICVPCIACIAAEASETPGSSLRNMSSCGCESHFLFAWGCRICLFCVSCFKPVRIINLPSSVVVRSVVADHTFSNSAEMNPPQVPVEEDGLCGSPTESLILLALAVPEGAPDISVYIANLLDPSLPHPPSPLSASSSASLSSASQEMGPPGGMDSANPLGSMREAAGSSERSLFAVHVYRVILSVGAAAASSTRIRVELGIKVPGCVIHGPRGVSLSKGILGVVRSCHGSRVCQVGVIRRPFDDDDVDESDDLESLESSETESNRSLSFSVSGHRGTPLSANPSRSSGGPNSRDRPLLSLNGSGEGLRPPLSKRRRVTTAKITTRVWFAAQLFSLHGLTHCGKSVACQREQSVVPRGFLSSSSASTPGCSSVPSPTLSSLHGMHGLPAAAVPPTLIYASMSTPTVNLFAGMPLFVGSSMDSPPSSIDDCFATPPSVSGDPPSRPRTPLTTMQAPPSISRTGAHSLMPSSSYDVPMTVRPSSAASASAVDRDMASIESHAMTLPLIHEWFLTRYDVDVLSSIDVYPSFPMCPQLPVAGAADGSSRHDFSEPDSFSPSLFPLVLFGGSASFHNSISGSKRPAFSVWFGGECVAAPTEDPLVSFDVCSAACWIEDGAGGLAVVCAMKCGGLRLCYL
eukprot:ANDGO_04307.mRNA.1 hypothetical protein